MIERANNSIDPNSSPTDLENIRRPCKDLRLDVRGRWIKKMRMPPYVGSLATLTALTWVACASTAAGQDWPAVSSASLPSDAEPLSLSASWTAGRAGFLYWSGTSGGSELDAKPVSADGVLAGDTTRLRRPSGGAVWTPSRLSDPSGRAFVVSYPTKASGTLRTASLTASGTLASRRSLTTRSRQRFACADMALDGTGVVAWPERLDGRWRLRVATRSASGRVADARSVAVKPVRGFSCAAGSKGRWTVATVEARSASPSANPRLLTYVGHGTKTPVRRDLGAAPNLSSPDVAIDGNGRSYVVWRSQAPDTEEARPWNLHAASVTASGRRASKPRVVAEGYGQSGRVQLAASPTSGAILTVSVSTKAKPEEQLALLRADGNGRYSAMGAPVAEPASSGGISYRADGTAAVAWEAGQPTLGYAALIQSGTQAELGAVATTLGTAVPSFASTGKPLVATITGAEGHRQLTIHREP